MAVAAPPRHNRRSPTPLRLLTAVPLCDGHDSAIMTINHELVRHGAEVVYLGYHQSAATIARAAVQEDVHAVGLSSYNGGHTVFFREVIAELRARGARDIRVFGGGGGTISAADARAMHRFGVDRIFAAGTPLPAMIREIQQYTVRQRADSRLRRDRALARAITLAENDRASLRRSDGRTMRRRRTTSTDAEEGGAFVLGIAGPGGAGKSTLIDELAHRFLRERSRARLAILANDPSAADSGGALLGDRVSAIYAQHDRVFFRSLATRGHLTGVSAAMPAAIGALRRSREFELIIVESVGIGQESDPFGTLAGTPLVDAVLYVTPPHYGGKLQLEKIALLHGADLVALNKCDDPRATTARAELTAALARNRHRPPLYLTTAARHQDAGVDALYTAIGELADLEGSGGERACQLRIHT